MEKLILVGAGGHCQSCLDVILAEGKYDIAALVDLPERSGETVSGYKIEYTDNDLPQLVQQYGNVLITLGQIKNPNPRIKLFQLLLELRAKLPVHISPLAYVSKNSAVGQGSIIMHQAILNSGSKIAENCIINTRALVEHGAEIGAHCHISTAAVVNGESKIGDACFVGSGAVIAQQVAIGSRCIIGAGATVLKDVPPGSIVKGVWP